MGSPLCSWMLDSQPVYQRGPALLLQGPPQSTDDIGLNSIQHAKTLDISGVSFHYLANLKLEFIRNMLHQGCTIRLLGMSPSAPGVAHPKPESVGGNIEQALRDLSPLMQEGNLEIRQYDYSPPFGLVIVDGKDGFLVVSTYPYRTEAAKRPQIVLRSEDNDPWHGFYIEQFDKMWKDAIPVSPLNDLSLVFQKTRSMEQ